MKVWKKVLISIGVIIVLIVSVGLVGGYCLFKDQIAAAGSIKMLEPGLYHMTYEGDYGLEAFVGQGGASSDEEVAAYVSQFLSHGFYQVPIETGPMGCSTIAMQDEEGKAYFGRNFDWDACQTMIVHTKPENGYESISTANLEFLNFGEDYKPEGMMNGIMSQAAIYVPLDGINEKGLCVADLVIDTEERTNQVSDKNDLTTTTAIRMMLDYAGNVEEALEILRQYDMHTSAGMMHHLAISDAEGNAVVVEYIDNEMHVTETPVVTNFYLTEGEKYGVGSEQPHERYKVLMQVVEEKQQVDENLIFNALQAVAQSHYTEVYETTAWSIVYDQIEKELQFYFRENFKDGYTFKIDTK
ncbi:MAG: linear amide C-N hydrolase [Cellulosilyticaceae bacterium]